MSHPTSYTLAHEIDSTLETNINKNDSNENCDQKQRARSLPMARSITPKIKKRPFSKHFKNFQRRNLQLGSPSIESFEALSAASPSRSNQIKPGQTKSSHTQDA
jgi:hypothetical protein